MTREAGLIADFWLGQHGGCWRSGCKDDQTSGDVGNVSSFQLPANVGPGGAGGACTNSMMRKLYPHDDDPLCPEADISYADLLLSMREFLEKKAYTQVPQLSSSYQINLGEKFCVKPPGTLRTKALLIGINYVGHNVGVLSGCHNDVKMMKQFITSQGFSNSPNDMKILMDDGAPDSERPTRANLEAAMQWLMAGARPGDAFFVHYSGHGSQKRDVSGDEKSGMDQTMVPVDYQQAGQIIDDWIFQTLVQPLPKGATMFCVMDCCHSGSIMDLPYEIVIDAELAASNSQAQLEIMDLGENQDYLAKYSKHVSFAAKAAAAAAAGTAVGTLGGPPGMLVGCCLAVCAVACCYQVSSNKKKGVSVPSSGATM